jgi:hypothetical protein
MNKPWRSLEEIHALQALVPIWRKHAGQLFNLFRALCLDPMEAAAELYPCPLASNCVYRIIRQPHQAITGQCARDPRVCDAITFTPEDVTPLELNWPKFGQALCKALNLDSKFVKLPLYQTAQIGTWSADAIPVFLTIQNERFHLRRITAELVARYYQKFILLAPSNRLLDAPAIEHLNRVRAAFFPLDNIITMTDAGILQPIKTPGELFAAFTPQPKDIDRSIAQQAFALVKSFHEPDLVRKAPLFTVFNLYCCENLSAAQIAQKCHCTPALVFIRLRTLQKLLGRRPSEIRQYASHFQSIQDSLRDPRAKRIRSREHVRDDFDPSQ